MSNKSLLLLFFVFSFIPVSTYGCSLTMRVVDYPPYFIQQDGKWHGINIEQAQALAERLKCRLIYKQAPWARGIEMLKTGKVDLIANMSKTPEREKLIYFVGPHRIESIRLVSYPRAFRTVKTWHQLMRLNATLMQQRGAYFGHQFEQVLRKNYVLRRQLIETVGKDIRMDLLDKKRVDGFMVDLLYVKYLARSEPQTRELFVHPLVINDSPVYFGFSKASIGPKRIVEINKAMDELIAQGRFQAVIERYQ